MAHHALHSQSMAESLSFPRDLAECHQLMAQQQALLAVMEQQHAEQLQQHAEQQQRYIDLEQVLEGGFTNCWESH